MSNLKPIKSLKEVSFAFKKPRLIDHQDRGVLVLRSNQEVKESIRVCEDIHIRFTTEEQEVLRPLILHLGLTGPVEDEWEIYPWNKEMVQLLSTYLKNKGLTHSPGLQSILAMSDEAKTDQRLRMGLKMPPEDIDYHVSAFDDPEEEGK